MSGTLYGVLAFLLLAAAPLVLGFISVRVTQDADTARTGASYAYLAILVSSGYLAWLALAVFWALFGGSAPG